MTSNPPRPPSPAKPPRLPVGAGAILPTVWATFITTVLLALAFSFGNVWGLGRILGVETHVAPLIGPAVDLTALGLLVVVPWLVLAGVPAERLKPANRLMWFAGALTLALNSGPAAIRGWTGADPRAWGLAAVEAIVPALLIAWSHVGPRLIALFVEVRTRHTAAVAAALREADQAASEDASRHAALIQSAKAEARREALEEVAGHLAEVEAARASEQRIRAELEASEEARRRAESELKESRRTPSTGASKKSSQPSSRRTRKTLEEWVALAKERLPEWQMETPTGPVIGSALDLRSDGTISKIRTRLEADRLALTAGGSA